MIRLCEGRYAITRREWVMLVILSHEGPLAPSRLAELAALDRPRTSMAIRHLLSKQLIERRAAPGDNRRALISVNAQGQWLVDELFPQILGINEQVLGILDAGTRASFEQVLRQLTEHAARLNAQLVTDVQTNRRRVRRDSELPDPHSAGTKSGAKKR